MKNSLRKAALYGRAISGWVLDHDYDVMHSVNALQLICYTLPCAVRYLAK